MQVKKRRSNRERTEETRLTLLKAARAAFIERGYGPTSTPEIVSAAGITRGALYHHFPDKQALFRAVIAQEMSDVASAIDVAAAHSPDAGSALAVGMSAYLDAMAVPGRARLLLLEAPAVLGPADMARLDDERGTRTLRDGLAAATGRDMPILAALLSAASERAALLIEQGDAARNDVEQEIVALIAKAISADRSGR